MNAQERALLQSALENKNMLIVYRDEISAAYYAGIPVLLSAELAVLAKECDFTLDGYVALALRDVTQIEQYDDNDFCRRVFAGEGVYQSAAAPGFSGCRNWRELLAGIRDAFGGWLSVECESASDTLFYVGVIAELTESCLYLRRVDADGTWHDTPSPVPYEDITLVSFGGNYLRVYSKYCRPPKG